MTALTPTADALAVADFRRVEQSPLVSVVLPVYNELAALPRLVHQLHEVFQTTGYEYELVFADDGSTDGGAAWLKDAAREFNNLNVVVLTRNFGQQSALQAGLEEARGDVVVVMDSDLQDDPAAIPRFLEAWRAGYDVAYAVRTQRRENWVKRSLFFAFYRVLRMLAEVPIPTDAGNFGLLDRRVVNHLQALPERTRFFPGLRSWVGFRQIGIPVARLSRYDAVPRVSFWQLVRLAKTAIFSFSGAPVIAFWIIALVSGILFCLGGLASAVALILGRSLPPITNTVLIASFFATLNATGIAVLGEYIVRILDQVQGRPAYLVDHVVRAESRMARPRDRRPHTIGR
jgi:dolichol-phosphate mannosyltransferase